MMAKIGKWFQVESYKMLRSPLLWVHLFVPLAGMAAMLGYYSFSPWEEAMQVSAYLQLLSMAFPTLVGVMTAMTAEREANAGAFQMVLAAPCPKYIPHITSVGVLLLCGLLSSAIAVCGFGLGFRLMGNIVFLPNFYVKAAALLFLGNIPLYLLQYAVGFLFGKGACLGLGIVGSLLSALLLTGLGDGIWPVLPWGMSIRFVSVLAASPDNRLFALPEMQTAMGFLAAESVVLLLILICWSTLWEGRSEEE